MQRTSFVKTDDAIALMNAYSRRTGLAPDSPGPPRRYLWTDAFAVCTLLELDRLAPGGAWGLSALRLIEQVHATLGRRRDDDRRGPGWLGGDADHPTRGGLRIGKPLPERGPTEAYDPDLEWERDGQYFHYLTKWMHALDQASRATGRAELNLWARELAQAAYLAFSRPVGGAGLVWKMSTDLSRALVPSMGHHDPLDGLVTFVQLQATADELGAVGGPDLRREVQGLRRMIATTDFTTPDPLGIGGLLCDACRVRQLEEREVLGAPTLLPRLLASALTGLSRSPAHGLLEQPGPHRLAFRELGLAIGLHAVERFSELGPGPHALVPERLDALMRHVPLASRLEHFWLQPGRRGDAHRDIDEVMLATSLVPDGFVLLHGLACPRKQVARLST